MATLEHANRAHALLSASGASRWINCTPSARLEEQFGERKQSVYADEGTLAHEFGELYLRQAVLQNITEAEFDARLEELMSNELYNEDMLDAVDMYVEYCSQQFIEATTASGSAIMDIEQKVDLTAYVPESFGTADCIIIGGSLIEIIDYKHGKGVPVYADYNRQEMLYALGVLDKYEMAYDITDVRLTIVQPRINNISSWQISVNDLKDWAENELKPAAALAFEGKGELNAGDWCKFCAVKNRCRKLYEQQVEIAKYEFKEPALLSDEEIADILTRTPKLIEWANAISEYALSKAVDDSKIWPGFKLVEGVSRRKWAMDDESVAEAILAKIPELSVDQVYETKLMSITAIEKTIGKKRFALELSDLTVKPAGKPTLVTLSDKRPALGIEQAQEDFR